jgi:hypothetical protein
VELGAQSALTVSVVIRRTHVDDSHLCFLCWLLLTRNTV